MDLLPTGSDELLYVQSEKVSVTIKGHGYHPALEGNDFKETESTLKLFCKDDYLLLVQGNEESGIQSYHAGLHMGIFSVRPLFFEQQRYEIIIEADSDEDILTFWHDNQNIRNKISRASRRHNILSGIVNFGNEIGFSDLVIQLNGVEYLTLKIEIYPTKLSYKEDYQELVADVTAEIYNIVFDFLKKTYIGYQQTTQVNSSPVEFFAVIRRIFDDFMKAADIILSHPHHILETIYEMLPERKISRVDNKSVKWIEKHPDHVIKKNGKILVDKAFSARKVVTYDTKENRFTKYILLSTIRKLTDFKKNYFRLQRAADMEIIKLLDEMIRNLNRRIAMSFLTRVNEQISSENVSLVFTMAPGYRDFYKYYLMLLRGLSITGDVFHISVKDLALLYEYWCFIKLNSMLKDRYEMVSQDVIKVQGNGLYVSLVKGKGSQVKYRDPKSGETITLSYNPKISGSPTVTQRPDNVLSLQKKSGLSNDLQYEYVFDAKYKINPALKGTDYYKAISHDPGPEVDDINTMHRYRDAIVYRKGASFYERTMFGAYVLFPYADLKKYREHRFYKSIEEVNIGGLPFLPSATSMVADMLDELIADSPDSAFERATLPRGMEEKLAKVDWSVRDVLVGTLKDKKQLDIALENKFYHIPVNQIREDDFPVRYVAIYQSRRLFGDEAGVRWYGEVTKCIPLERKEIVEIPSDSTRRYYRFEIKEWRHIEHAIKPKEFAQVCRFTNIFLLEHSMEYPELFLRSEEEFRLYMELKRVAHNMEINDDKDLGFCFGNSLIIFEDRSINIYIDHKIRASYEIRDFINSPNAIFRRMRKCVQEYE